MLLLENTRGLDLDATLGCGQTFLWRPLEGGGWAGVTAGRAVTARMEGTALVLEGAQEEDRAFWENYFALDMDYPALLERFCAGSKRLAVCVEHSPGIRVLRQPFFETLCCFIISQNNNIPRIAAITGRLCEGLGEKLGEGLYSFPAPEALAAREPEDLAFLRAGWRAEYLIDAARLRAPRKVIAGYWQDEAVQDRLGRWMRAAVGVAVSKELKVMRFGDNMREVAVTEGDKVEAQMKLGWQVNTWPVGRLVEEMNAVTEAEIDALMEEYRASYDFATDDLATVRYQAREVRVLKVLPALCEGGVLQRGGQPVQHRAAAKAQRRRAGGGGRHPLGGVGALPHRDAGGNSVGAHRHRRERQPQGRVLQPFYRVGLTRQLPDGGHAVAAARAGPDHLAVQPGIASPDVDRVDRDIAPVGSAEHRFLGAGKLAIRVFQRLPHRVDVFLRRFLGLKLPFPVRPLHLGQRQGGHSLNGAVQFHLRAAGKIRPYLRGVLPRFDAGVPVQRQVGKGHPQRALGSGHRSGHGDFFSVGPQDQKLLMHRVLLAFSAFVHPFLIQQVRAGHDPP